MIEHLRCRPRAVYIDCTVGEGGHAEAILEATAPDGRLIGMDRDEEAIQRAGERLRRYGDRVRLLHETLNHLGAVLETQKIRGVDGILMDLGVSTLQLMDPRRGFSFQKDGPLDMRMDQRSEVTAADLVNSLSEDRLARLLSEYGEERWSKRIARAVVHERKKRPITTTVELVDVIRRAVPPAARFGRLHPATKTFQALRIAVNQELEHLALALETAVDRLNPDGRLCVIGFHSLEDRIVKRTFKALARSDPGRFRIVTKKPIVPSRPEIESNPRSRSAKLRVLERMAAGPTQYRQGAV